MNEDRPAIPAEIRRRVLVEAGHRCAIPSCRYIEVDVHHIIPWETSKIHEYENLIALCPNCHRRADKEEIDRKSLRLYKANLRFAHDKFSNFEMDLLFVLNGQPDNHSYQIPPYLLLLIKRLLDAQYIRHKSCNSGGVFIGGGGGFLKMDPDLVAITPKGREFIQSFGQREL